jgi:hypothetical protein
LRRIDASSRTLIAEKIAPEGAAISYCLLLLDAGRVLAGSPEKRRRAAASKGVPTVRGCNAGETISSMRSEQRRIEDDSGCGYAPAQ